MSQTFCADEKAAAPENKVISSCGAFSALRSRYEFRKSAVCTP
jgi:hypothetical protein